MERLTIKRNDGRWALVKRDGENPLDNIPVAVDKLASYEDAEEQGLLVRLPCKPREVVWAYYPKYKEIERIAYMTKSDILEDIEIFRAVICKTREEAEAALKEG